MATRTFFCKSRKEINTIDLKTATYADFTITTKNNRRVVFRLKNEDEVFSYTIAKNGQTISLSGDNFIPGVYFFRVASSVGRYIVEITSDGIIDNSSSESSESSSEEPPEMRTRLGDEDALDEILGEYTSEKISVDEAAARMFALGYRSDWLVMWLNMKFSAGKVNYPMYILLRNEILRRNLLSAASKLGKEEDLFKILNDYTSGKISVDDAANNMLALGYRSNWLGEWLHVQFTAGKITYSMYEALKRKFLHQMLDAPSGHPSVSGRPEATPTPSGYPVSGMSARPNPHVARPGYPVSGMSARPNPRVARPVYPVYPGPRV